jgi:hypothetical protein
LTKTSLNAIKLRGTKRQNKDKEKNPNHKVKSCITEDAVTQLIVTEICRKRIAISSHG